MEGKEVIPVVKARAFLGVGGFSHDAERLSTCPFLYGTCIPSGQEGEQHPMYENVLSARATVKTREKEVEIQLTLKIS